MSNGYINPEFKHLFKMTKKQRIKHDAFILMARFLSEIETIQDEKKITRKKLAKMIDVSPSYLTQVFRGNKPLNFITLAKIQMKLKTKFFVTTTHNPITCK